MTEVQSAFNTEITYTITVEFDQTDGSPPDGYRQEDAWSSELDERVKSALETAELGEQEIDGATFAVYWQVGR